MGVDIVVNLERDIECRDSCQEQHVGDCDHCPLATAMAAGSVILELRMEVQRLGDLVEGMNASLVEMRKHTALLAGRIRNAHTLLEHDEDHKAMVLLAETWLEHSRSHPSTERT